MSIKVTAKTNPHSPMVYQIRIQGHLGRQWTDWFEGLSITLEKSGESLLTGPLVDQAALFGVLRKINKLGLTLISVNPQAKGDKK